MLFFSPKHTFGPSWIDMKPSRCMKQATACWNFRRRKRNKRTYKQKNWWAAGSHQRFKTQGKVCSVARWCTQCTLHPTASTPPTQDRPSTRTRRVEHFVRAALSIEILFIFILFSNGPDSFTRSRKRRLAGTLKIIWKPITLLINSLTTK